MVFSTVEALNFLPDLLAIPFRSEVLLLLTRLYNVGNSDLNAADIAELWPTASGIGTLHDSVTDELVLVFAFRVDEFGQIAFGDGSMQDFVGGSGSVIFPFLLKGYGVCLVILDFLQCDFPFGCHRNVRNF